MKNSILILLVLALGVFTSCNSDNAAGEKPVTEVKNEKALPNVDAVRNPVTAAIPEDTINVAKMSFSEEVFEYGSVKEGETVEHVFKFTNTGKVPLTIQSAKSTCGCTVPEYPKEPIAPGEGGEIAVRFNSKGKSGRQRKPVNIVANTWPAKTTVFIDGTVEKDPNSATATNKK